MALTRPNFNNITTTVTSITDPLLVVNKNSTAANVDIGFVFNRDGGSTSNVALIWDETNDQFVLGLTSNSGATNSNVVVSSYANVRVGGLTVDTNTLHVDPTNNRVGIGTTSPAYQVEIENTGSNALLVLDRTDGAACFIEGQATRSAFGSVGATPLALAYNSYAVVLIGANGAITVNPDGDGFTFPTTDGSANNVLATDGSGNISFTGDPTFTTVSTGNLTITGSVTSNVVPSANVTYSLGDETHWWKSLYVSGSTIYIGGTPLTVSGGTLLVDGQEVQGGGGNFTTSNTTPVSANYGDLWYDTDTDILFQYINDGSSNVWIDIGTEAIVSESAFGNANVNTLLASWGSNTLSTTGNISAGGVLTNNYYYANGTPFVGGGGGGIGSLVEDTSPQLGGDLDTNNYPILMGDNVNLFQGAGFDYAQRFNGDNFFQSLYGGTWNVANEGGGNWLLYSAGPKYQIQAIPNAAVELYYNNSKKFETSNTGVTITGNISTSGVLTDNYYYANGAPFSGGGGGGASTLNDLSDVTISSPSNGQVLKYNGSAWVNGTDAGGATSGFETQFLLMGA